jgi:hypothetical protein
MCCLCSAFSYAEFQIKTIVHSHPPLIDDSIHRQSHNMTKYPNDRRSPVDRRSPMHVYWQYLQAQSRRPAILVACQCNVINVHCFSSHFATFRTKLAKLWASQWKAKQMLKLDLLINESLIAGFSWNQFMSINGWWLYVLNSKRADPIKIVALRRKSGSWLVTEIGSDKFVLSDLGHSCCKKKNSSGYYLFLSYSIFLTFN